MHRYLITILVSLAVFPGLSLAEEAAEVRIVDMQRLISESIVGKAARSNVESEAKKRESALAAKKLELDRLRDELTKQSAVLSGAALEDKRAGLDKKIRDFEGEVRNQREELSRRSNAELQKVVQSVDAVVHELGKSRGYKFVLEKDDRLVIYADRALDITEEVLGLLNSKSVGM